MAQGTEGVMRRLVRRFTVLAVGIGIIWIGLPRAAAQGPASDARKIFEEGNALFEKGENDKALASYDRAIALDGKQADFHLGRCRTLARLQRHADAIASCSTALSISPDLAAALLDRGHFLINTRQVDRAVPDLLRARALNADAYGVVYHLALAYYILGDYQKAGAEYEHCAPNAKTPENVVGCSAWQYVALARAGRQNDAKAILDRVQPDLKLQSGAAYLDRLLLFKGDKTEDDVAKGMAADNLQLPTVAYSIGIWHLLGGRQGQAREYFEKAVAPPAQQSAFGSVAAYYELQRMHK